MITLTEEGQNQEYEEAPDDLDDDLLDQIWNNLDANNELKGGPGSGRHPEVNSSLHDLTIEKSDRQWITVHAKDKDGNRVGRLQLKPVGRNYQVNEVVVDKEHQGQGIASSLYQHAHDTLQSEGRKLYTSSIQTKDGERMLRAFDKRGWLGKEISLGQKQVRLISIPNKKSLPLEYLKSEYNYASTQINISDCLPDGQEVSDQILKLGKLIDKKLLDDKGLEDTIHVTIKYGLHDEDPTTLKKLLSSYHGLNFTIGKLDVFNAEDTGADYDVVILRVISSDLVRLNKLITENLDNTETFKYNPHVTISYVKAGAGQDIISGLQNPAQGKTLRTDFILFSDKDGKMTRIPLGGTANMASKIDRATLSNNIRTRLNELQMEAKGGPGSGRHPEGGTHINSGTGRKAASSILKEHGFTPHTSNSDVIKFSRYGGPGIKEYVNIHKDGWDHEAQNTNLLRSWPIKEGKDLASLKQHLDYHDDDERM